MLRNALTGSVVFGLSAAAAGYVWTAFEFPFVIVIPAIVGSYFVTRAFGRRKALIAGAVGGVAFTVAFLFAVFLALTDGSPVALSAWASATLAAALAGAAMGAVLRGVRGSVVMAAFSASGMLGATLVMGLVRALAPASVDVAGPAQYLYVAVALGLVGAVVGAALGAGAAWLAGQRGEPADTGRIGGHMPHGA